MIPLLLLNLAVSRKTKVVIYDVEEDIDLVELVEDSQQAGLVTAQRLFARAEGLKYATTTILLEFNKDLLDLPEVVSCGIRNYPLREYIPPVIRCFKCQKF